jgi:NADH:ubiquinone oxidoreductase subunit 3 (subunit A)
MTDWIIWGALLFLQNAAHTATSRSRNTKNLTYTGIASIFSNGIWFASQFYIVNMLIAVKDKPAAFLTTLAFYIILTATGSVASHWYLMRFESKRGIQKG